MKDLGTLGDHLRDANVLFDAQNVSGAVSALTAAVDRLHREQDLVASTLDRVIASLSTHGGPASAPHPNALALIKLRTSLPL